MSLAEVIQPPKVQIRTQREQYRTHTVRGASVQVTTNKTSYSFLRSYAGQDRARARIADDKISEILDGLDTNDPTQQELSDHLQAIQLSANKRINPDIMFLGPLDIRIMPHPPKLDTTQLPIYMRPSLDKVYDYLIATGQ